MRPDVPTVAEAALPGFELTSWGGTLAPKGVPDTVVEKLNADIRRAEALPEFQKRVAEVGGEGVSLSSKDSAAFLDREFVKWAKVVRDRNIKAE